MNTNLITDLEIIRDKLSGMESHTKGHALDFILCARRSVEGAISTVKKDIFETPYSERITPQCTCGEPHISQRIAHRYDGKPCYVKPWLGQDA